jgi:hypothetical protein
VDPLFIHAEAVAIAHLLMQEHDLELAWFSRRRRAQGEAPDRDLLRGLAFLGGVDRKPLDETHRLDEVALAAGVGPIDHRASEQPQAWRRQKGPVHPLLRERRCAQAQRHPRVKGQEVADGELDQHGALLRILPWYPVTVKPNRPPASAGAAEQRAAQGTEG